MTDPNRQREQNAKQTPLGPSLAKAFPPDAGADAAVDRLAQELRDLPWPDSGASAADPSKPTGVEGPDTKD